MTSETRVQHTPGPWRALNRTRIEGEWPSPDALGPHIVGYDGNAFDWVATCQVSNVSEWRANARLIAAAPDLLAALEALVTASEVAYSNGRIPALEWFNARAAIRRARGEE
jgi:hypothetical protein